MAISLHPEHLIRYKDIARLIWKYGRSDLLTESGLDQALDPAERNAPPESAAKAGELAADLERMGPIYVKMGQVLSSRPELLPAPYVEALARLQDKLEPFPFPEARKIIESELGVRLSKAFSVFEETPIATASLGQVYRAALRDGRQVAVKVQRPGIKEQIAEDMAVLTEIAEFLDAHTEAGSYYQFAEMLDEFRINLARELDYHQEERHLIQFHANLEEFPAIVVPQPVADYCTAHVLTMEYIPGRKITDLGPLAHQELNGSALAEALFDCYLKQILLDGFFHADPHPGNVLITPDGRLALIDLGMVGHISPAMQGHLLKLLLALSEGRSEEAADLAVKISQPGEDFDRMEFKRRLTAFLAEHQIARMEDIQIGKLLLDFSKIGSDCRLKMPRELSLLSKALLNLDDIARILDPQFNPNEAIRRHAMRLTQKRMQQSITPGNIFSAALEAKEFVEEMPGRVNRILDAVANNQIKVKVEAIDEATLIEGFQKVANRITTGLILAALIIGAAMLMRVETTFRLYGYPGFAMLCFLVAAGGGFWLVLSILLNDRKPRTKPPG